jgi:hypothetical protein
LNWNWNQIKQSWLGSFEHLKRQIYLKLNEFDVLISYLSVYDIIVFLSKRRHYNLFLVLTPSSNVITHTDTQHDESCLHICFEKGGKIWIWIKLELNLNWIWIKFGLHWKVGQLWTPEKTNYIEIEWVQYFIFILNSQCFWKWTNANPMKNFRQTATVSNLTL